MAITASAGSSPRGMTREEKKVIFASSLGTVFEWYDFYLYGSLAVYHRRDLLQPVSGSDAQHLRAAGLRRRLPGAPVRRAGVRPHRRSRRPQIHLPRHHPDHGSVDLPGRPAARLGVASAFAAPIILIALRMLQGLALGGEYGGAATYVAEHAPNDRRGFYTSWIQTTATLGLFLSLIVILIVQGSLGKDAFAAWGWRIPFLVSVRAARRLGLDPPVAERIAGLPEDEGGGQGLQGAADGSLRPVEERQDRAARAVRRSPPARPWSGIAASSTRCSSCRTC